jgi:tRNA(adenine34) deaminase
MSQAVTSDEEWMRRALAEADIGAAKGEVPVGCIVVGPDGTELASAHNLRESSADPTGHAEVLAVRAASAKLATWRLDGSTVFATLEPCAMCAGALVAARIGRLVYGCDDPKAGAVVTLFTIGQDARLNHRFALTRGVLGQECAGRLTDFFGRLRALGKK